MSPIVERKRAVLDLLDQVASARTTFLFRHEMMAFCYVVVCGAIEYCIEILLKDWLKKACSCHAGSIKYKGRKFTESFIQEQLKFKEKKIDEFTSTKLEKIQELVRVVSGEKSAENLKEILNSLPSRQELQARLDRINRFRHDLAHGQKMPLVTQPNIQELKEDFLFVYKNLISKISACLPRVGQ